LIAPLSLSIDVVLDRFVAVNRADRSVTLSGNAQLKATANELALSGKIVVDRGRVDISRLDAPALSSDVVVIRKTQNVAVPTSRSTAINLNLVINLGDDFQLRGRGLETFLRGDITLTSPQGQLSATGTIRTRGGTYRAYAQRLVIDRGQITFSGPIDRPRLDILAIKPNFGDEVGVAITGSVQQPRVKLYSNPARSETDTLALLMLGRNFDELGRDDTALVQQAALALLSGEDGSIAQRFGLDNLSLRQGTGETKQTIVTVGKQISERLYVGYEQGVSSALGTIELIYRISPRFTLRAQAGADTALDGIFTIRWR
jgi:translocation and assembly module TamB